MMPLSPLVAFVSLQRNGQRLSNISGAALPRAVAEKATRQTSQNRAL